MARLTRGAVSRRAAGAVALALLVLSAFVNVPRAIADEITFARDRLAIETSDGRVHAFDVELALTPVQRARGLMFREVMAPDAGMLFLFDREEPRAFWMKNTYLPLDMVFIDREGFIVAIATDTVPLTETPVPSGAPALAVLELNAGTTDDLDIAPGDRVLYPAFEDRLCGIVDFPPSR